MTQRTCNIIKACKDYYNYQEDKQIDNVKRYLSEECLCPIERYTNGIMDNIMFEAMCDYLDSCDRPSVFLNIMENVINKEKYTRAEQIAIAFELVQVRDGERYINGFSENLWYGK